jgi:hypothetical protein
VHECCTAMPAAGNAGQDDALAHVADERGVMLTHSKDQAILTMARMTLRVWNSFIYYICNENTFYVLPPSLNTCFE